MNKKLTQLSLVLCALGAGFAANAATNLYTPTTTDEIPASFQRMLDHRPDTTTQAIRTTATRDPLLKYLTEALQSARNDENGH
jgi:hypothetical protein